MAAKKTSKTTKKIPASKAKGVDSFLKTNKPSVYKKSASYLKRLNICLNSLKTKKYFPFLIIFLIFVSVVYFARGFLFAAIVDGKPISRVKLISELEKQGGQQALESLVTMELISQEAKRRDINITDFEVNAEIERITNVIEAQGTTLEAALSMQGQTMADLTQNIKIQKTVEHILGDTILVNDEEIRNYYEENKIYYGEDTQFEEVKESIKETLIQQKLSSEFQVLLQKLKSEGNIIYLVDFD